MAKTCFENPIIRDGVSQQQRLTKALLPEYVAVDERKIEELKAFVLEFSEKLHFYGDNNETDGNWSEFFNQQVSQDQQTEPHFALFQAFLELFSIAQGDLNTMTARHLDFYYKDVLRLKENPPVPDQVFVIFELAKHVANTGHVITEGTRFKAGKDETGANVFYATKSEISVNKATIGEVKSIYKDPDTHLIHQSAVSNSGDGLGGDFENDAKSWYPFGNEKREAASIGFAFASPILNLAEGIRKVILKLTFKEFTGDQLQVFNDLDPNKVNEAFRFYFSGAKEWIVPSSLEEEQLQYEEYVTMAEEAAIEWLNGVESWQEIAGNPPDEGTILDSPWSGDAANGYGIGAVTAKEIIKERNKLPDQKFTSLAEVKAINGVGQDKINDILYTFGVPQKYDSVSLDVNERQIILTRTIGKDKPAIVPYLQKKLIDPFETTEPVMKVILDTSKVQLDAPDNEDYIYPFLEKLELQQVDIDVDVREVGTLVVQNDRTVMDPSKNMAPFGITPVLGSTFYIGNHEVFQKQLLQLDINLEWFGLPEEDFETYYKYYNTDKNLDPDTDNTSAGRSNSVFQADIALLDKRKWNPLSEGEKLFNVIAGEDDPVPAKHRIRITGDDLEAIPRDTDLPSVVNYDTDTQKGFVRLELANKDFGHQDYQIAFTQQILNGLGGDPKIPNQPYNPTLKTVSLNYKSTVSFDCQEDEDPEEVSPEKFFHVHPFGATHQVATGEATETFYFLPQFPHQGELFIGIDNLHPAQNLSVLFQVLEGSEDADTARPDVTWTYLSENQWLPFKSMDILSDSTNGLLTSGIINFSFYKETTKTDTVLTTGKHWIRATIPDGRAAIPEFVDIITQAVVAEFEDESNDPNYLAKALAAETIAKLEFSDSSIRGITQPFASFGGAVQEESTAFYTRVSERLRHKQRAITIWDYERMILQAYPSVYKVKCLNHTRYTGNLDSYNQLLPGHVSVIVVSNVQNKNAVNPITPQTSLNRLEEIKEFLDDYRTDPIELHVQNPAYEKILVDFKVKFRKGYDKGFYERQLEDEIKAFLSPWAYDSPDITFGGRIHQSRIIGFIDEREYVDFVTCFKMFHLEVSSVEPVTEAIATTSASILCSTGGISDYGDHRIQVLNEYDNCGNCNDNIVDPPPPVLSTDHCCDEDDIAVGDQEDLYSYSVPDLTNFPDPPQTELCPPLPEPEPVASMPSVVIQNVIDTQFNAKGMRVVYLFKANTTYFIPITFSYSQNAEVVEVPDQNTLVVKGDHTKSNWTSIENLFDVESNPAAYTISQWPSRNRAIFDGTNTRLFLIKPHKIQAGHHVNLFRRTRERIRRVFLPKVTEEMVAGKARINLQLMVNAGNILRVRPSRQQGIDRLQLKGSESTIERVLILRSGIGMDLFSVQLEATRFESQRGFNDLGWTVIMENENYYKENYSTPDQPLTDT